MFVYQRVFIMEHDERWIDEKVESFGAMERREKTVGKPSRLADSNVSREK